MADATRKPAFVQQLSSASDEERALILARVHPAYSTHYASWEVQLAAFEGDGGFLDGSYLWPYQRESQEDFNRRQAMARYHNYLETLIDLYVRFMFTAGVRRSSKNQEFNAWQEDVDGAGTSYNDLLRRYAAMALTNGHAGLLVDKTQDQPTGPSIADEQARVIASIFTAGNITDWRFLRNDLIAAKLKEAASAPPMTAREEPNVSRQNVLIWDKEGWARYEDTGALLTWGTPDIGMVPLVILRPKPSHCNAMLGRALVSNANVIKAVFNRASEEDEVLRAQAFSVLTVSVHPEGDVASVRESLGSVIGTAKAIVVKGEIDYKTPDQSVPGTVRDNISYLVQEMYRAAHVRMKKEGLAIESGESIRLQYTELNEMLQGFSKSLAQAEQEIARAWFAWTSPTAKAAQQAFEAAKVEAEYPDEFFLDALMTDLEAWAEALRMNLGPTMAKRIKKRAVRRIDPQIDAEDLKVIDAEIDAMKDEDLNPNLVTMNALDTGKDDDGTSGSASQRAGDAPDGGASNDDEDDGA